MKFDEEHGSLNIRRGFGQGSVPRDDSTAHQCRLNVQVHKRRRPEGLPRRSESRNVFGTGQRRTPPSTGHDDPNNDLYSPFVKSGFHQNGEPFGHPETLGLDIGSVSGRDSSNLWGPLVRTDSSPFPAILETFGPYVIECIRRDVGILHP